MYFLLVQEQAQTCTELELISFSTPTTKPTITLLQLLLK